MGTDKTIDILEAVFDFKSSWKFFTVTFVVVLVSTFEEVIRTMCKLVDYVSFRVTTSSLSGPEVSLRLNTSSSYKEDASTDKVK